MRSIAERLLAASLSYFCRSWGVLFSHPADFTPVCTTELGVVATLIPEFGKRNTKVIALSCDPVEAHQGWIKDIQVCAWVEKLSVLCIGQSSATIKFVSWFGLPPECLTSPFSGLWQASREGFPLSADL